MSGLLLLFFGLVNIATTMITMMTVINVGTQNQNDHFGMVYTTHLRWISGWKTWLALHYDDYSYKMEVS